jgi:hypothetical protein
MKIEYSLLVVLVAALYAVVKNFLPDLPISDSVFQVIVLYLLSMLGVEFAKGPADAIRATLLKK